LTGESLRAEDMLLKWKYPVTTPQEASKRFGLDPSDSLLRAWIAKDKAIAAIKCGVPEDLETSLKNIEDAYDLLASSKDNKPVEPVLRPTKIEANKPDEPDNVFTLLEKWEEAPTTPEKALEGIIISTL
jgi:hypothetical protein